MRVEHVGDHSPDPPEAEDDDLPQLRVLDRPVEFPGKFAPTDPTSCFVSEPRQERSDRETDRGDDLPELRGLGRDHLRGGGGGEHDQRGLAGRGHQHARLGRGAAARSREPEKDTEHDGLEQEHADDCAEGDPLAALLDFQIVAFDVHGVYGAALVPTPETAS